VGRVAVVGWLSNRGPGLPQTHSYRWTNPAMRASLAVCGDLLLHAKTEGMSRWISVHLEEGVFLFNGISKYAGTELDRTRRGQLQIGHGEIKMDLLWLPIRPLGGHELSDTLKGQLQWQFGKVNFAPRRVSRVNNTTE
jgi:hypothetical protein